MFLNLNSQDDLLYWKQEPAMIKNHSAHKCSLTKHSIRQNRSDSYYGYTSLAYSIDSHIFFLPVYPVYGIFKLDDKDNIYCALSDKYRIDVISPRGRLLRSIERIKSPRKLSDDDTKGYISRLTKVAERGGNKPKFIIPDRMPALADLFILDKDYLLTITYENPLDSSTLKGDLFDNDGKYVSSVEVPRYYLWESWKILYKKCAAYKNGFFYAITETGEGEFALKRYRLDWK